MYVHDSHNVYKAMKYQDIENNIYHSIQYEIDGEVWKIFDQVLEDEKLVKELTGEYVGILDL